MCPGAASSRPVPLRPLTAVQDMKLLDFTGRKVDPSLLMGSMKSKKEQDPNIKVRLLTAAGTLARPLRRSTAPTRRTCRWCSTRRRARPRRGNQSSHQNPSLSQRGRRYGATLGFIIK